MSQWEQRALLEPAALVGEHHAGEEAQGASQVADRADDRELAATDLVNDGQRYGRDEVHEADDDGADVGKASPRRGTTCELHDLRREDRVDTGELVTIAMQNAMRMTCGSGVKEGDLPPAASSAICALDSSICSWPLPAAVKRSRNGRRVSSMSQEPARESRHGGKEDEEEDGGDGRDAEQSATRSLRGRFRDHRVGGVARRRPRTRAGAIQR